MSVLVSEAMATRTIFRCRLCGGLPELRSSSLRSATASPKRPRHVWSPLVKNDANEPAIAVTTKIAQNSRTTSTI